ncbi:MAG: hypothetical protein CMG71_00755 [Candidatus Marinimicrobia bacterium]|nr:hypothetical protein [Candidatus Neomarinimicrobiota bacterium]|tara:strand:+ start:12588 stop:13655 length:1068 start_codon:yes stop_codon:yes gene_type:complete
MLQSPVRRYILSNLTQHQKDIVKAAVRKFGLSRQAVLRHMKVLILDGKIEAHGKTRDRYYVLKPLVDELFEFEIIHSLDEDVIGRRHIYPHLKDCSRNLRQICEYGFSQIMNNVIVHSRAQRCKVRLLINEQSINFKIWDNGEEGLLSRVASSYKLDDPRCAALELTKGKISTDFEHHTGEGIFFVSRLFDSISIRSNGLELIHNQADDKWLIQRNGKQVCGTSVSMHIRRSAEQTIEGVMARFSTLSDGSLFDRTEVPVSLVRVGSETLMSRAQAQRLLRGLNHFDEVTFDFSNIQTIGQPFADEIFRVFPHKNGGLEFNTINATPEVESMIARAANGKNGYLETNGISDGGQN